MTSTAERALAALRVLTRASHLARPDDLPSLVQRSVATLGAARGVIHVIDYDQVQLVPFLEGGAAGSPMAVDGTLAGRAYSEISPQLSESSGTLWTPILDGTERLGVLEVDFADRDVIDDELRDAINDVAVLVAELLTVRSVYGDSIERARRGRPMTTSAELQWQLLPPLSFVTPDASICGVVLPVHDLAGDSFDYALNGDVLHVALVDAMGHGVEASLLAAMAISSLRNSRRNGVPLHEAVAVADAEIGTNFGLDRFVTAIVGELNITTGVWTWITCGHPPALLVRDGRVVRTLDDVSVPPLGLGLFDKADAQSERLQRGDRLLLYTDGVIEARHASGEFFGTTRLVDFVVKEAAAGRPASETLRKLNLAILAHQEGALQDDATTVLIEWSAAQAEAHTP